MPFLMEQEFSGVLQKSFGIEQNIPRKPQPFRNDKKRSPFWRF